MRSADDVGAPHGGGDRAGQVEAQAHVIDVNGVAEAAAIAFWPNGIGLLLGLAIFRLIALVMTGLPLLKELKQG